MGNPPFWVQHSNLVRPAGRLVMPGVSAGVKAAADVNSQPRQQTKFNRSLQAPATWTYIWVGGAFLYLAMTYFGIARVSRLGN